MFTLRELLQSYIGTQALRRWNGTMYCVETDADLTLRTNETQGYAFIYSYTLVRSGCLTLLYGGQQLTFCVGDLYIYSPGLSVTILSVSDYYRAVCLMADEGMTLSLPVVRKISHDAAQPIVELSDPKLSLPPDTAEHLHTHLQQLMFYQRSAHHYQDDIMQAIYSAFLLDLQNAREQLDLRPRLSSRIAELFSDFLRLLPQNFAAHHDIGFYADRLHITSIYLSRLVRQATGRTVVDYINQYLLMEASFLLRTTDLTIAQIADRLHFADSASFSRFFTRLKGTTPRSYRSAN